jgi:hypothetical protein
MTEELKECQLCHQILPKSDFYKRKDRDGEHNWMVSYCKKCEVIKVNSYRNENIEKYRKYNSEYNNQYYHTNKNKVIIIQKRYYYNKLPLDKKEKYKKKLQEKYPDIVNQICI